MSEKREDDRAKFNQKIINIGGTALLGSSFMGAATVAIGRSQDRSRDEEIFYVNCIGLQIRPLMF